MGVTFIPSIDFRQTSPIRWTVDGWGVDHASVVWRGPATRRDAFTATLKKFSKLAGYNFVFLADWEEGSEAVFPTVTLNYVGFKSGAIPLAKSVNSKSAQSVQAGGTDTASGEKVSGTIYYTASRTNWTWFTTSKPDLAPQYATVDSPVHPGNSITGFSVQGASGTVPISTITAILNSLVIQTVVTDYKTEPLIPGALYACESCVDYKFTAA